MKLRVVGMLESGGVLMDTLYLGEIQIDKDKPLLDSDYQRLLKVVDKELRKRIAASVESVICGTVFKTRDTRTAAETMLSWIRRHAPLAYYDISGEYVAMWQKVQRTKNAAEMEEFVWGRLVDKMNSLAPNGCAFGEHPTIKGEWGFWAEETLPG